MNHRDHVVFEDFAGAQAGDGDVLLAVIGVDRRLLFEGGAEVLDGVGSGFDYGAVGFDDADVGDLDAFVGGVVADLNLSPLLDSGLALHLDAGGGFLAAGAIAFKTVGRAVLLDDEGLLGIIVLGCFRLGGGGI